MGEIGKLVPLTITIGTAGGFVTLSTMVPPEVAAFMLIVVSVVVLGLVWRARRWLLK
jgi:hypothetical protein